MLIGVLILVLKVILKALYVWLIWIPINLNAIAVGLQFLIMNMVFGTIHSSLIKDQFGDNMASYLFFFIIPFGFPMLIAVMACFAHGKMSTSMTTIEKALAYRSQKAMTLPDKKVYDMVHKTSALDFLNSNDSEIAEKARAGMEANYGNQPPNKLIENFLKDD